MQDCDDEKCEFNYLTHVHFKDERLDVIDDDEYIYIHDRIENSYMRISKLSNEFIKKWEIDYAS